METIETPQMTVMRQINEEMNEVNSEITKAFNDKLNPDWSYIDNAEFFIYVTPIGV